MSWADKPPLHRLALRTVAGGSVGLLLGLWTAGWWILTSASIESGWLFHGLEVPVDQLTSLLTPPNGILAATWQALGWPLPSQPSLLAMFLSGMGLTAGSLISGLTACLRIDERLVSLRALIWSARSCSLWPSAAVVFLTPLAVVAVAVLADSSILWWVALGFGAALLAGVILLPIALCRPQVVGEAAPGRWWTGPYTDRDTALVGAVLCVIPHLVSAGATAALPSLLLAALISAILQLILELAAVTILVNGSLQALRTLEFLRWRTLSPWLAMHLLLLAVPFALVGPVTSIYALLWKVVPVVATLYEGNDLTLPLLWRSSVGCACFVGRYWHLLFGFSFLFLYWLGAGRVVWLSRAAQCQPERPVV